MVATVGFPVCPSSGPKEGHGHNYSYNDCARCLGDRVVSVTMDDRKRAEESPRGGEDELRDLIENVPAMVFIAAPGPSNTYASRGWREYSGLPPEDTEGLGWQRAVHPEDLQRHMEKWRLHSASGEPFEDETRFRRAADGTYRWFLVRAVPRRDEQGNVLKWYGTLIDIEDRKRAEESLRRSEAYLAEGQRLTHTGSFAYDAKTLQAHHCSEEDLRIWDFNELPSLATAAERMHPDDRDMVAREVEKARAEGTDFEVDFRIVLPDGTLKHIHSICHPVFSASGDAIEFVGTHVDVTERKRAEEERERQRVRHLAREFELSLEARVAERTRIARELHDTLLQSFYGSLLQLKAASILLPRSPEQAKQILGRAIDQAAKAINEGRGAVQALRLSVSSIDEPDDLVPAIEAFGKELAADPSTNHAPSVGVDVEGRVRSLKPKIRGEIYRITCEALRNAFQHSQGTQIAVELRYDEQQFRVCVRDDGKGIDAKVLADGKRDGHYGLCGMRERADLVGAKLDLRSGPEAGTEVELTIAASHAYLETSGAASS
jgi:PAS domain S-box-containing protein